ncbi:UDP-glucuronate 4-dehydrogenase, decarboxylating [Citrifermentans bemidjiense Bem]|uniref:UDP-glucuronate 4-dehydrogenase, decarboxylating n=1 Tax=Citrifermentans bemidjiense (strain ATCC BAA-1014 / DSM 16622 / JCM 12645 / Bem) TaxID=404380 RepID=B5E817_CITBB|nr:bifunctional UDP-4-keto-pentose/UDP-xylose synthase [Citrifermentans bemidjiense]ACH39986.1 UDP-glucuronate 4-dehydrogenase, decarboxylating [Citrifermentans bemidjiense Bem]
MKVLILGVNGFIGNALTHRILTTTDWEVFGLDMASDKLERSIGNSRFHFLEGDITINKEWIEYNIKKCDVVLPLVAIATPITYVKDPLRVFELDFEENLKIIRLCAKYNKRIIFPSTSEVYGMSPDREFDEENSPLMLGPINKERWIYSCAKQMLDRVIYAYGAHEGLRYTLFRPFNWIGPKLDSISTAKEGSSRVLTQFLYNILAGEPIQLVDGGEQRRSFTFLEDGIDCLMRIIENRDGCADSGIFNIGNPDNDLSVKELAHKLVAMVQQYPEYREKALACPIIEVSSAQYYGKGYQDMLNRVPSVKNAKARLGWEPRTTVDDALKETLDFYLIEKRETIQHLL